MAVIILPGAQDDLFELKLYMLSYWDAKAWDKAEEAIFDNFDLVDANPKLGKLVPELAELGIFEFRQVLTAHHKIIYEPDGETTFIHLLANFKQDFQTILSRRILSPRRG